MHTKHLIMLGMLSMCPLHKTSVNHFCQYSFWIFNITLKHLFFSFTTVIQRKSEGVWLDVLTALLMKMHVCWWTRRLEYWKEGNKKVRRTFQQDVRAFLQSCMVTETFAHEICTKKFSVYSILKEVHSSHCWLGTEKYSTCCMIILHNFMCKTHI